MPQLKSDIMRIPDLSIIFEVNALLGMSERLFLYSLVDSLRPKRVLEIGTNEGGSAHIIGEALDANGGGRLATIDINPKVFYDREKELSIKSFVGNSPDMVKEAATWLGNGNPHESIEFAFIDGSHEYKDVLADIRACLPYMRTTDAISHFLFHDCFYQGVRDAIYESLYDFDDLRDTGVINYQTAQDEQGVTWGGLHLLSIGKTH